MKFSFFVIIPAGISVAFFAMQYLTTTEGSGANQLTREEIETQLSVQGFGPVLDLIETGFPEEVRALRADVSGIMTDPGLSEARKGQRVMEVSRAFTDAFRRDHAALVGQAPEDSLLEVQRGMLALLEALRETPELCARVALSGPQALERYESARIDPALLGGATEAVFAAILAAQASPEPREAPSEADWSGFVQDWLATDEDNHEAIRTYMSGEADAPEAFCEGAISFRRQLLEDGSPGGVRIMAEFSQKAASL